MRNACPRMLRSATDAFTRVFDALWGCAASGVHCAPASPWVPALRCIVPDDASHRRESAAPRPGHETYCVTLSRGDAESILYFGKIRHRAGGGADFVEQLQAIFAHFRVVVVDLDVVEER